MDKIDDRTMLELEAAAFRTLRHHLMEKRTDVQNIDLMNMAGFCRNCLARWVQEAANERGIAMDKEEARTLYYGMPYETWKDLNQTEADAAKKAAFDVAFAENVGKKD
jgi:hypothetical protein